MKTAAKNNSITVWRILFTYMILIFHFDNKYCISTHFDLTIGWYIAVEFFFIVSGYLLYTNLDKLSMKCRSGWDYFVHRFAKIYPYYLCAFLFSFAFYFITKSSFSIKEMIAILSNDFFEIFALHGIGLNDGWTYINNSSWYISIMLISGLIIYHCLIKWKDSFCNFIAPLIIIVSFSNLYRNMQCIGACVETTGVYTNLPLMRGLADMCLGIFAARLTTYIKINIKRIPLIRPLGLFGFLFVIICSLKYGNSTTDFLYALILTVSIGIAFLPSSNKFLQFRPLQYWSSITMSMYFVHDAFRTFIFPAYLGLPNRLTQKFLYLGLYLVVVTVFGALFDAFVKWLIQLGNLFMQVLKTEKKGIVYYYNPMEQDSENTYNATKE